jgi:hypothetical protein
LHGRDVEPLLFVDPEFVESQIDHVAVHAERGGYGFDRNSFSVGGSDLVEREFDSLLAKVSSTDLAAFSKNPMITQARVNRRLGDIERRSDRLSFLAGEVATDEILHIECDRWTGHVFNLQTEGGWYFAGSGGVIAHNCAKRLVNLGGVAKVFYTNDYRIRDSLVLLERAGIQVMQRGVVLQTDDSTLHK